MKTKIETNKAPKAIGPYSQGIVAGEWVFTAGQIPMTTDGQVLVGTIEEQTHQVMSNLNAILMMARVTFDDVVKTTMYLTDFEDFARINEVYQSYFKGVYPVRETVGVNALPKGVKLEISMVAIKKL